MREETKKILIELRAAVIIAVLFIVLAALVLSIYSRVGISTAVEITVMQVLRAGTNGALGNIFYVTIIFLTLGITVYIFERVIILLTEFRIGGVLMKAKLSSIKDHFIVCGSGRVGTHAAERLKKSGKKVVIIEHDVPNAEFMKNKGFIVVEGDCMSEEILEKAGVRKAKGIIACTGEDNKNVFVVLTAKDLNPNIKVATRVNDQKARGEFERAGANIIVTPEVTGGYELADKMIETK